MPPFGYRAAEKHVGQAHGIAYMFLCASCVVPLLASPYAQENVHKGILGSSHTVNEAACEGTMSSLAELAAQPTDAETSESKAVPNHESLCSVVVDPTFVPPSCNFVNGRCLVLLSSSSIMSY